MNKLVLQRVGRDVYFEGRKLTRVDQATKGPNKEVIKIDGLPGSNGQKWVSLNTLVEGDNELTCSARDVTIRPSSKGYQLTPEEAKEVADLEARVKAIVDAAKARFVPKPKLDLDPSKMTAAERQAKIDELVKYYGLK